MAERSSGNWRTRARPNRRRHGTDRCGEKASSSSVRCLDPHRRLRYPRGVHRLIDYLRQHLMIDFQGDVTVGKVRELLAGDDSRDAKALMAKLVAENSAEDMMLVLADCLLEHVQRSLTDDVVREQIRMYTES
jgi:hypothetical protein